MPVQTNHKIRIIKHLIVCIQPSNTPHNIWIKRPTKPQSLLPTIINNIYYYITTMNPHYQAHNMDYRGPSNPNAPMRKEAVIGDQYHQQVVNAANGFP